MLYYNQPIGGTSIEHSQGCHQSATNAETISFADGDAHPYPWFMSDVKSQTHLYHCLVYSLNDILIQNFHL